MSTPTCLAASRTLVPGATSTSIPSIVSLGTVSAPDERLELVAELLDVADVWSDGAVVEGADGRPRPALGDVDDGVEVFLPAVSIHDAMGHPVDPPGGLAARCALPAGLVRVEPRHHHQRLGDRDGLVEHDDARRPDHRSCVL